MEALKPVNGEWIHEFIVQPLDEGAARYNRGVLGFTTHSLHRTTLDLKERTISIITGLALMLFPFNIIIWIAWQTFGNPERLSTPYCPEVEAPPSPPPAPPIAAVVPPPPAPAPVAPPAPPAAAPAVAPQLFAFNETSNRTVIKVNWRIEFFPDVVIATQSGKEYSSTSLYNPDWTTKEFHQETTNRRKQFDVWFRGPQSFEARLVENGVEAKKEIKVEKALPLIQQMTFVLKHLSNQPEFPFYTVFSTNKFRPWWKLWTETPPFAMHMIAKKVGEDVLPGFGRQIKVEVTCANEDNGKAELWFDPETGALRKFINPFEEITGEYATSP
ncbi:MAG TPA: hypothetical protein VLF94_09010 [Chlamydiales bacterium]|nr:hypothetical protein [Chlamydiales bacterium]